MKIPQLQSLPMGSAQLVLSLLLAALISASAGSTYAQKTWGALDPLTAAEETGAGKLGTAVSISGNSAVVGVPFDNEDGQIRGAVRVYEFAGGVWEQTDTLRASDGTAKQQFGSAVAISGDRIIVGAQEDSEGAFLSSGAAYIFERNAGEWREVKKLVASDTATLAVFGCSVSIDGDIAIVGAYGNADEDGGASSGAAYIFERNSVGEWEQVKKVTASDAAAGDRFGYTVSVSKDKAVVGAPRKDDSESENVGAAYIFERSVGEWKQVKKITALDAATGDQFGYAVSISGKNVFVGAPFDDGIVTNSGAVYAFNYVTAGWQQIAKITASEAAAGDLFGSAVSVDNDTAIVGAPASAEKSGRVYTFQSSTAGWQQTAAITASNVAGDQLGLSVSISGDRAISGAPHSRDESGAAYVLGNCDKVDVRATATSAAICKDSTVTLSGSGANKYIWSDGVEDNVAFQPQSTVAYVVTGIESATGCRGKDTVAVAVRTAIATVDKDTICLGDFIKLSGLGGMRYTWNKGASDRLFFSPDTTTTYTVTGTDEALKCSSTDSIKVVVKELPTVEASADTTSICLGDSVKLNGSGATTYSWDKEVVDGVFFKPQSSTTYTVTGTDELSNCSNEASIRIEVRAPSVTASTDKKEVCSGGSVTLSGSGATTYAWSEAGVQDRTPFFPQLTATYTVTGTDDEGCSSKATIEVVVYEALTINFTPANVSGEGVIDIRVSGGNIPYTFDWDNDGTGDFDDSEDLSGVVTGTYVVVAKDKDGCTTTQTVEFDASASIDSEKDIQTVVYPNPAHEQLTVQFSGAFDYVLSSAKGVVVGSGHAVDQTKIATENLAKGIYFVTVYSEEITETVKVVKK